MSWNNSGGKGDRRDDRGGYQGGGGNWNSGGQGGGGDDYRGGKGGGYQGGGGNWNSGGKGGGRDDFRGGKGGDRWGDRRRDRDDDERLQQHHHFLEGSSSANNSEPIKVVQLDALVFLQIMKHCRQDAPSPVTGMLLGLDTDDTLQVTHSFGYKSDEQEEDEHKYQVDMLRRLREVNMDSNTVGWYQTTHLGAFVTQIVIKSQFRFQTEISRSVLLVYDSLQSAIGKPAFKALQLTPAFMKAYKEAPEAGRAAMHDFPSHNMFMEIPVRIASSVMSEAFLVDWAISDPLSTTSQVGILDVENQAFLEKNVTLLINSIQDLINEQENLSRFERNASRGKGDMPQKGRDRRQNPPWQLDTMIVSQQIQNYCRAVNSFAGDSVSKIYLLSNKPSGTGGSK